MAIKGIREKVQLATKFGIDVDENGQRLHRGDPEYVRSACEGSLKRLGVEYVDLYYQILVDSSVPIEITVGKMKKLVEEGKVNLVQKFNGHMLFIPLQLFNWSGPSSPVTLKKTLLQPAGPV